MRLSRLLMMLGVALACAACYVGDPLVDVFDEEEGIPKVACFLPPRCMPVTRGEAAQHAAIPVATACAQECVWQTSGGDSRQCPVGSLQQLPKSAHCMLVEVQPLDNVQIDDVDWHDVNLPLRADRALTIVLRGGKLQRVYLELEGPITLRIEALEQFEDLRIVGRANAQGAPHVEISVRRNTRLSVSSAAELFPGEIRLAAGVYEDIDVNAVAVTAESVIMQGARLRAETITLTDVTLERAQVDTKHALWSAFAATDAELRFCGDARLIAGQMASCSITTCAGTSLRMFNDSFVSGSLDGDYELSDSNVENVQLGPQAATRVFAYGSAFSTSNLCENTQLLVLGNASRIKCSECADTLLDNLPVCAVEERSEKWLKNYCRAWSDEDPLPLCSADTPTHAQRAR